MRKCPSKDFHMKNVKGNALGKRKFMSFGNTKNRRSKKQPNIL